MINKLKSIVFVAGILFVSSCDNTEDYTLGDLTPPSNLKLDAQVVGQTGTTPNGDGSGDVIFTITADNALSYRIDYDASDALNLVNLPKGTATKKYTKLGTNTYVVTAVVYGSGGTSSTITKEITVVSNFNPDPAIVNNLTGGSSKTWVVDKSIAGHFGVGPWANSATPEWWKASVNEKVNCCNCFYTANFTFAKQGNSFTIQMNTPEGIFSKGTPNTTLSGIPQQVVENGNIKEFCYPHSGSVSQFSFAPAISGIEASTKTSITLSNLNTVIGYGSVKNEYEILELTATSMYLRVQGTETGNAWYLKLKSL